VPRPYFLPGWCEGEAERAKGEVGVAWLKWEVSFLCFPAASYTEG